MKSIKFKNIKLPFVILFFSLVGCQKLDESPKSFIAPETFFTTPAQVEATFAATMDYLWNYWGTYGYGMSNFRNDDQLLGGNLTFNANHASGLWAAHYSAILNLNNAIRAMKDGSLKGADTSQLMAQAKFLRGYNYFMLVRMFGDLPLMTDEIKDPFKEEVTRSSIADVYKLIVEDLTEATQSLPEIWPGAQVGRPARDAARGMLAKVYLTMATAPLNDVSNYAKAADLARQVIEGKRYSLVKDIKNAFSVDTKYGPEMMWSYNSNYEDMATEPQIWTDMDGWGDVAAEPEWEQKFPDGPRKEAYLQTEQDGVHYTELGKDVGIKKYLYDTESDFEDGRSIINFPIIRFADVLLIFAEAENMSKGAPTQAAVDALNQVIDRANGYVENPQDPRATIGMTKEAFDTKVIQERNWELCFEYDRWFDLIRKRILKEESREAIQQNYSEHYLLFPIPANDLRINPLLTQNPGY